MPTLHGVNAQVVIEVADRFIPEGVNSWSNNWLQAEIMVKRFDEDYEMSFCTRVLTVHDLYGLYFHVGIVLQGLSKFGVLVSLIQRQLDLKIKDKDKRYEVELALGQESMAMAVEPEDLKRFAGELRLLLDDYPLRAEEFPSVAPIIEFYSTHAVRDRIRPPAGVAGWLWSLLKVRHPAEKCWGDALKMSFTLSTPGLTVSCENIESFFRLRGYKTQWEGDTLRARRGSAWRYLRSLNSKELITEISFSSHVTHSFLEIDVWTAGVRQNNRKLFAWVGEAAMLEVLLAGGKSLSFVSDRLENMDRNLHRLNIRGAVLSALGTMTGLLVISLIVSLVSGV